MHLPAKGEIFLDHVGLFTADMAGAAGQLERLGFRLTPFTRQVTPDGRGGYSPTGTANRCAMLRHGYVEVLTAVSESALAKQLDRAVARYPGLHLIAFAVADPDAMRAHLEREGFAPQPLVHMSRPVTIDGRHGEASFTIVRVAPGAMPEGRVQCLRHEAPEWVWLPEFMSHENGAEALTGIILCVADPVEVSRRYARFTGRVTRSLGNRLRLQLDRGYLDFVAPDHLADLVPGVRPPSLPFMAAMSLSSGSIERIGHHLRQSGVPCLSLEDGELLVPPDAACGAAILFQGP